MAMNSSSYRQGMMLGRYQLSQMIGQGATGEVWAAYDTSLRRRVAIKMLPPVFANDKTYLQLFTREAQAAASLEHPYILPVHDYGQQRTEDDEIVTYLVMPLVTGGTLRDRIRAANGPLSLVETTKYLGQAAQAIDYAHSRQIIHRDIKPGNMLLQNDWLYLTDFGIAKLMTGDTRRSQTVSGSGTPEYIAPEQAQGHAVPASDQYSLAIVAYQMLAGRLPFQGEAVYQILLKQISEMPPSPRQFNPQLSPVIEQVILRGMAKRPEERYQSCMEFMQALQQASSQPLGNPEGAAPWNQNQYLTNPLARPSGPVFPSQPLPQPSYAPQPPTDLSRRPYQPGLTPPPPPPSPTSFPLPGGGAPNGKQAVGRRTFLIAGTAAGIAVVTGGSALAYYLHNGSKIVHPTPTPPPPPGPKQLMSGIPLLHLTGHNDILWNVVWDPSSRYLATAGEDTHVMVWDVGSALQKSSGGVQTLSQPLRNWKLDNKLEDNYLHWTSDGHYLVASTDDQSAFYVLDVFTPNSQPQKYVNSAQINSLLPPLYDYVATRPGQNEVAVNEFSLLFTQATVGLWKIGDTQGPVRTYTVTMNNTPVGHIGWSKDGTMLAISSSRGEEIAIVDAQSGQRLNDIPVPDRTHGVNVRIVRVQLAWSPIDRNTLAAFDLDAIMIYNPHDTLHPLMLGTDDTTAHTPPAGFTLGVNWLPEVAGIDWSPNGRYIVGSYISSNKIYIWDLQDPHPRKSQDGLQLQKLLFSSVNGVGHTNTVTDTSWSPDGRYVASGSFDNTAIVWKVDAG